MQRGEPQPELQVEPEREQEPADRGEEGGSDSQAGCRATTGGTPSGLSSSLTIANPAVRLFGVRVTVTNKLATGTAILADMSQVAVVRDMAPSVVVLSERFAEFDQQAIRVVTRYRPGPAAPGRRCGPHQGCLVATAQSVADFLGRGDDPTVVALAGETLPIITAMARSYCRGNGWLPVLAEDLDAVLVTATARMMANPDQLDHTVGETRVRGGFSGWSLAETFVLNAYRRRAG